MRSRYIFLKSVVFATLILTGLWCRAQKEEENEPAFHPHSEVALVLSHAEVFQGANEQGRKELLSLPAWGLNYNFWFHPKWAIGLHTDIIVEKFEIKKTIPGGESETIERSHPVAPALMAVFRPNTHWMFELGMGGEFSSEENFVLNRAGLEYTAELTKNWEVFGTLSYDFKWNAYDTWVIGIGISKSFGH